MRVTNQMMTDSIKTYLSRHTSQLLRLQEQIATGKCINRASDDPVGMQQAIGYRKQLAGIEQYELNIDDAKMHIDMVEEFLAQVTDLLKDAEHITSDPNPDLRDSLAEEVSTIREQILEIANSKNNGNYVFGGDRTGTRPFDSTGVYAGDNGTKDYLIGQDLQIHIEADGSRIFQGASDVFSVLEDLQAALLADDSAGIDSQLQPLRDAIDQITTVRAENASRYKRLEAAETHYAHLKLNVQQMLSNTESADMAQSIIEMQMQQSAYESTLAVSAKIIQPSLIDFLS